MRMRWGFEGFVVSDAGAVGKIFNSSDGGHFFANNVTAACAAAVGGGCDIDYGHAYGDVNASTLRSAVAEGLVAESDVRRAARRALRQRMRLGTMDAPGQLTPPHGVDPWKSISMDVVDSAAHRALALKAATASFVLLKNDHELLPLRCGTKIAVLGPAANDTHAMISRYTGNPSHVVTMLEGLRKRAARCSSPQLKSTIVFIPGIKNVTRAAAQAAACCDVVVAVLTPTSEGESHDREVVGLPVAQVALLAALAKHSATDARGDVSSGLTTVIVLVNGGAIDVSAGAFNAHASPAMGAIVESWHGGEEAGTALAALMFGDADFSGRMPVTTTTAAYAAANDFLNMSMQTFPGRTHRFLREDDDGTFVLYPYGHGLSYSTWAVESAALSMRSISREELMRGASISLTASIVLLSKAAGSSSSSSSSSSRSVLAFACRTDSNAPAEWPLQWLLNFTKVHIVAGNSAAPVSFELGSLALAPVYDDAVGDLAVAAGTYRVWLSDDGTDCRTTTLEFSITAY